MDTNKQKLIDLFNKNVRGKKPDISNYSLKHDGKVGNWLEKQFGKNPDNDNKADFFGYELKNETRSKTTFGDWSANYYIFKDANYAYIFKNLPDNYSSQDKFCELFGLPNKDNRYSWSGLSCPQIDSYNICGQTLRVCSNYDIIVLYSYSVDKRPNKHIIIPIELRQDNLIIAKWFGIQSPDSNKRNKSLKQKLEDKFNDKGWFTCKTRADGRYEKICFGKPINYNSWIELVKSGVVFFDSGMYQGNKRPYSMWRANNSFWNAMIIEEYD